MKKPMVVTQSLRKWGNGTGVRIPKKVVEAAKLKLNQTLEVSLQGKSIVLTPIEKDLEVLSLEELVSKITPQNKHAEIDWGPPVGKEIW